MADNKEPDTKPAVDRAQLKALLSWYEKNKRSLPWRDAPTPYHVYVSEIMLQQTRVEAVKSYYLRFLTELPDLKALAAVQEDRLLKLWEGLGYYTRARNLKKTAELVVRDHGGELPREVSELKKLPGIGDYTAGAISSIAYKQAEVAIDGNALRVFARLRGDERNIAEDKTKQAVRKELKEALVYAGLSPERYSIFNQAVMDLGATICLPTGRPDCENCPLKRTCIAHKEAREQEFPVKTPLKKRRIEKRTVFVVLSGNRILLRKRPETGLLAGMYEFPNVLGHLSEKELEARFGKEEMQLLRLPSARHIFSHVEWEMEGYLVKPSSGAEIHGISGLLGEKDLDDREVWAAFEELSGKYSVPKAFKLYTQIALDLLAPSPEAL